MLKNPTKPKVTYIPTEYAYNTIFIEGSNGLEQHPPCWCIRPSDFESEVSPTLVHEEKMVAKRGFQLWVVRFQNPDDRDSVGHTGILLINKQTERPTSEELNNKYKSLRAIHLAGALAWQKKK